MPHEQTTPLLRCACGRIADCELSQLAARGPHFTCGHYDCERHALGWGALTLRHDDCEGWRHYLHGLPVSCGSGLMLALGPASDFARYPNVESMAYTRVRYESPLATSQGREPPALLYALLGPYDVIITGEPHMRLRWPGRPAG